VVNKEPDHDIMQQLRFGKADGLSHEPLQPCSECEMFPFNLLCMCIANSMLLRISMTIVHVCTIGIEMANAKWG
jgi:hypothetical protein